MTGATTTLSDLFGTLFRSDASGLIELRGRHDEVIARDFFNRDALDSIQKFINLHADKNLWFGVALRNSRVNGRLENCGLLFALFLDVDFTKIPESKARALLERFPVPPSIIIMSGGGLHTYWLLKEPLDLQNSDDRRRAYSLLRRLALALDGDLAAAEPARVLRVPETLNYKYTPARPVVLETFEPERQYNLCDLDDFLPEEPEPQNGNGSGFTVSERIKEGERNSTLYKLGRSLKAKKLTPAVILATLRATNAEQCEPPLSDASVERLAAHAFEQPDRPNFEQSGESRHSEESQTASAIVVQHLTDLGNAKRLVARHGEDLRFCHPWRSWFVWDGTRWARDATGEVTRRAKETALAIYEEAAAERDDERRKALAKHATRSESEGKIKAMVSLAESEPSVAILPDQMDRDVWVLNVLNGTIDLRTGELRLHRREDFLTKRAPVTFDPGATCSTWEAFLYRIMGGNRDLVAFLQRVVGYSLTGDVSEQILLFLHGLGANGKTTLLNLILTLAGEYGRQAVPELLLVKRGEAHPTERADLAGRRFVACVEVEEGRRMAEVMVKQLTGGDRQTARRMREDFFEFPPTAHIWLGANHRPMIRGTDYAIWRRIALVPFKVTIPPEEQDRRLPDKLRAELPGILAWAVRGCLEWQATGLRPPGEVQAATQEYRAEQDVFAEFFADRCITGADEAESARALYGAFEEWCGHSGEKPVGSRAFGMALRERGFRDERRRNGKWWKGIGLAEATTA